MIKKIIPTYCLYLVVLCIMDITWFYFSGDIFYRKYLHYIIIEKILISPAIVFYFLYALGITIFVLNPGIIKQEPSIRILLKGFLFGLCSYGAYNLTNQATIKDWPIIVTIIDMTWGTLVTGFSSLITILLINFFN